MKQILRIQISIWFQRIHVGVFLIPFDGTLFLQSQQLKAELHQIGNVVNFEPMEGDIREGLVHSF